MKWTNEEKKSRKEIGESFASFGVGALTISLMLYSILSSNSYSNSDLSWVPYIVAVVGLISILIWPLLFLPYNLIENRVLQYFKKDKTIATIKLISWTMVIASFAYRLFTIPANEWFKILGIVTGFIAFIVLIIGLLVIDNSRSNS